MCLYGCYRETGGVTIPHNCPYYAPMAPITPHIIQGNEKFGTCEIWNGEIWCGENLAPILKYHRKMA